MLEGSSDIQLRRVRNTIGLDCVRNTVQPLLVKRKQRGLDREIHQDPDRDRCTPDEECIVVDHGADKFELIAVSKHRTKLLRMLRSSVPIWNL